MERYFGESTPKLGFGMMRLPRGAGGIDAAQTARMVDLFLEAGFTYFDTAFVYVGSEEATRKALVERHPRESFTLASKLNAWLGAPDEAKAKSQLHKSLKRAGVDYFDYYLLHALQNNNAETYERYGLWDFVREQKEKGLIRHWGFSFHADPALLEELLAAHPDAEFVQLQINYADWENPGVASRRNWEICRAHGKPVVVMEPVKGGILAEPIPTVKAVLKEADPASSCASWAIRYAASLEGILAVLSGMSSLQQMDDNLKQMTPFRPLDEGEMKVIAQAQKALDAAKAIPCTACRYCTKGCPMGIPIPDIFTVYNRREGSPHFRTVREYTIVTTGKGKANECVACGQCESVCPQHLPIIELLEKCREMEE